MAAPTPYSSSPTTVYAIDGNLSSDITTFLNGTKWGGAVGTGATVYYSFPTSNSTELWDQNEDVYLYAPGYETYAGFRGLTISQQAVATTILQNWASVANINLSYVATETANAVGDIRIAFTSDGFMAPQDYAYAYFPGPSFGGDVWLNAIQPVASGNNYNPGGNGYHTILHEVGHALGLEHSFGGFYTLSNTSYESFKYTVMSYSDAPSHPDRGNSSFYPTTPMLLDIQAMQYLYGANMSHHAGDDIYVFNGTSTYYQTIWDAGGNDTIQYVSATGGVINLEAGSFSVLGKAIKLDKGVMQSDNVAIAYNVTIENAIGGDGHDTIYGNSAANSLDGGNGNDSLYGYASNDTLNGGAGNDYLDGGADKDTMMGGVGDDVYIVDDLDDVVLETLTLTQLGGVDLVKSSVDFTLGDNVDNLILTDGSTNGGLANLNGTGNAISNIITGNAGNNVLDGKAGNDSLFGGLGNDTYVVDVAQIGSTVSTPVVVPATNPKKPNKPAPVVAPPVTPGVQLEDTVTESLNAGTDTLQIRGNLDLTQAAAIVLGANLEVLDASNTGTTKLNLTGNSLDNTLVGNSADNLLDGGSGLDTLAGGDGSDTYWVDIVASGVSPNVTALLQDTAIELANQGVADTLKLRGSVVLTNPTLVSLNNTLAEFEQLDVSATATTKLNLEGNAANNVLVGNAADNVISGGDGNDTLDGGLGNDSMDGGQGNDTYVISSLTDIIIDSSGNDTVQAAFTLDLTHTSFNNQIENATLLGTAAINATGNTNSNALTGNDGANILDGAAGNDTMSGGKGNDIYIVDDLDDVVIESLALTQAGGVDLVKSSVDFTLGDNVDNLTLTDGSANGGLANLNGTGNALNNVIIGNAGNNILDGKAGYDNLSGGLGNDTYIVDLVQNVTSAPTAPASNPKKPTKPPVVSVQATSDARLEDTVTEVVNAGTDTMQLRGNLTLTQATTIALGANLENLNASATGTTKLNLTGNALDNTLTGNDADNILDGGTGVDTLIGGLGNDTYVLDLKLSGTGVFANVNTFDDTVTEVNGTTDGIDTIKLRGAATLTNASTLVLDGQWANIENLDAAATGATKLNLSGNDADNILIGNAAVNILTGGLGNDTLDGGAGADTLIGGDGNDIYIVDNIGDVVTEDSDEGTDEVRASVNYTLGANIESLTLTGVAINGTGNSLDNVITGNASNNILDGKEGADTLIGGKGNDTYIVDNAGDVVTELLNEGIDLVKSSIDYILTVNVENLTLTDGSINGGTAALNGTGNALSNIITGNAGNNILNGGLGNDILIGGAGNDVYVFDTIPNTSTNRDTIQGFNALDDLIQLDATIFNAIGGALDTSEFRSGAGATTALTNEQHIIFNTSTGALYYDTDGLGGQAAVQFATLTGLVGSLNTNNFSINQYLPQTTNPTLYGTSNKDYLGFGGSGTTLVNGLTGSDVLYSYYANGSNIFVGDEGNDIFVIVDGNRAVYYPQYIIDFTSGQDKLKLDISELYQNRANGITSDNFVLGSTAIDANDFLIYNRSTGDLFVDSDGNGPTDKRLVINFTANTELKYSDFLDALYQPSTGSVVFGTMDNDNLVGTSFSDILIGSDGNDTLTGGLGSDILTGGDGNDTFYVDKDDVIVELENGTIYFDTIVADFSVDLTIQYPGIENIILTGSAPLTAKANGLTQTIQGNDGDNTIDGTSAGSATFYGGMGNDTYILSGNGVGVVETLTLAQGGGLDTIYTNSNITVLPDNVENLIISNGFEGILIGNQLNNSITGGIGQDTLIGGVGNDTLTGGLSADTFVWNLADKGVNGNPSIDKVKDFNSSEDKLDLRDLLVGESSGNILNYLDITTSTSAGVTNTEVRISNTGGFTNGNYSAAAENQHITLAGVNLLTGTNEADLLANLISQNKLIIDV